RALRGARGSVAPAPPAPSFRRVTGRRGSPVRDQDQNRARTGPGRSGTAEPRAQVRPGRDSTSTEPGQAGTSAEEEKPPATTTPSSSRSAAATGPWTGTGEAPSTGPGCHAGGPENQATARQPSGPAALSERVVPGGRYAYVPAGKPIPLTVIRPSSTTNSSAHG